jgi:hypothetical protein
MAWSVPRCMPALSPWVGAHPAPMAVAATAFRDSEPGIGTFELDRAAADAVIDLAGIPGADRKAAGRVSVAALGAVLRCPDEVASGSVAGAALVAPDFVAEGTGVEVAGAPGAVGGCAVEVTTAVIEYAGAADNNIARTTELRFMDMPFIGAPATIRGMSCRYPPSRRSP